MIFFELTDDDGRPLPFAPYDFGPRYAGAIEPVHDMCADVEEWTSP